MKRILLILLCLPLMTLAQLPTVTLLGTATICAGDNTPLYFTLGGNPNFTVDYTINGVPASSVFNSTGVNTLNVTPPVGTNTYVLTSITDGNGVVENNVSGSVTITVNPLPTITASSNPASPLCDGDLLTLTGGGAGSTGTYTWTDGTTTYTNGIAFTPAVGTVIYTVTVTDGNSCENTDAISVTVNPLPTATISGSISICIGQSTALDFNFTGTGPYSINYGTNSTNTSAMLNNNVDSIVVSPSATTTYTLIDVTDAFCSNTAMGTVIVTVNPLPSASISGDTTICADGSTVPIDIIIANGTPPFNVIYSDGFNNVTLNVISSPYNFQTNTAGNYTLSSVIDFNGCSGNVSGVAIVVVNPLPVASFSFWPQPVDISNPTVYFTDLASGHIAGIYDFGDGTTDSTILGGLISHTYLDTGSYQVLYTVTSINGCTATVGHTIIIDPASTAIFDFSQYSNKTLIKITDILGRETKSQPLFYIYDDGTVEKRIVIE